LRSMVSMMDILPGAAPLMSGVRQTGSGPIRRLIAADRAGRPQARRTPAGHPQASKTHCKRGHQFTADNTYYTPDGRRRCRTCLREAQPVRASKGGGSDVA
jgi:hypothetical protein